MEGQQVLAEGGGRRRGQWNQAPLLVITACVWESHTPTVRGHGRRAESICEGMAE